ncbi:hypothetical protein D3C74_321910 [compost metagenome]
MAIEFLRQFSGRRGVQDDLLAQRFGGASGVKYRLHRDFQLEQHDIGLLQLVQVLIDIRGRHPVVSAGDHNDAVVPLGDIDRSDACRSVGQPLNAADINAFPAQSSQ